MSNKALILHGGEDVSQLLLAKASELVAVLPSTREWSFIETQRLAG